MAIKYLEIDINEYIDNEFKDVKDSQENKQITLFDNSMQDEQLQKKNKYKNSLIVM